MAQRFQDKLKFVGRDSETPEIFKPFPPAALPLIVFIKFISFFWAFLEWQVVTGMEAKQITESLANYVWFLRVPNADCISHLLLFDRSTPVDL